MKSNDSNEKLKQASKSQKKKSDEDSRSKKKPTSVKSGKSSSSQKSVQKKPELAFNVDLVCDEFENSISDPNQIEIASYIQAYGELIKFLNVLGTLFTFVSQDVKEKMKILTDYGKDPINGSNYRILQTMIDYEVKNKISSGAKKESGTETFLRLHRGLNFISQFVSEMVKMADRDSIPSMAQKVYENTLAKYHDWFIRQVVYLALFSLPTRDDIVERVCGGKAGVEIMGAATIVEKMKRLADVIERAYKTVDLVYLKHDSLKLLPKM